MTKAEQAIRNGKNFKAQKADYEAAGLPPAKVARLLDLYVADVLRGMGA